jgi:hypothetical protein
VCTIPDGGRGSKARPGKPGAAGSVELYVFMRTMVPCASYHAERQRHQCNGGPQSVTQQDRSYGQPNRVRCMPIVQLC